MQNITNNGILGHKVAVLLIKLASYRNALPRFNNNRNRFNKTGLIEYLIAFHIRHL